jgi:hypothetical protein
MLTGKEATHGNVAPEEVFNVYRADKGPPPVEDDEEAACEYRIVCPEALAV